MAISKNIIRVSIISYVFVSASYPTYLCCRDIPISLCLPGMKAIVSLISVRVLNFSIAKLLKYFKYATENLY